MAKLLHDEPTFAARFLSHMLGRNIRIEADLVPAAGYEVDFLWREQRRVVEVDGYAWHHTPDHMRNDFARQNALAAEGWTNVPESTPA